MIPNSIGIFGNAFPFLGHPVGIKGLRHSTPAHVLDKSFLFFWGCRPAFSFDLFEHTDSGGIVFGFLFDGAFADVISVGYAVVGGFSAKLASGGTSSSSSANSLA